MLFIMMLLSGALTPPGAAQGYVEVDSFDSSLAALDKALQKTADGSNHSILLALRQLRDEGMQPIFQSLLLSDDTALRVDGLLALAEIGTGTIDPFLMKTFTPEQRMITILAAIDLELMDGDTITTILEFPDLRAVEFINLAVIGRSMGVEPSKERLQSLASSEDVTTRCMAAILLAELKIDATPLNDRIDEYSSLDIARRERLTAALSDLGSRQSLPSALPLLKVMADDEALSRGTRLAAVDACLACDCPEGTAIWLRMAGKSLTSGDRMRLGIMGLDRQVMLEDWTPFRDGRRFNDLIADAGEAVASQEGLTAATTALVRARNPILMDGALAIAERSDPDASEEVWNAIIEASIEVPQIRPVAVRVVTMLADRKAACLEGVVERLRTATDATIGEVAMIGLLNAEPEDSTAHAERYRDHPSRTVRSLAVVLEARNNKDELDRKSLDELAGVASGAGRVDPAMRAVAAWLWLKHSKQHERAVARIVGEAS